MNCAEQNFNLSKTKIPLTEGNSVLIDSFLSQDEAGDLQDDLMQRVKWHQPEIVIYGRKMKSPRLSAWCGDAGAIYRYSGTVNHPVPWIESLYALRERLETFIGSPFNSVLLNLYRDGNDAMGWHADDEAELGNDPTIASVSLGGRRRFLMKPRKGKAGSTVKVDLDHGSLLVMAGATQRNWKHSISRTRKPVEPRINLTFRHIRSQSV